MLGNIYLHHVLDLWFERDVRPRLRGKAHLIRYADDFVIGFEREDDAKRVMAVLRKRFERFGLKPASGQDPPVAIRAPAGRSRRAARVRRPSTSSGSRCTGGELGADDGRRRVKTRRARLRRAITAVADWCRRHRHEPVKEQHAALSATHQWATSTTSA